MPHDKIKAAARERMAQTGEPYTAARRAAVTGRQSAEGQSPPKGAGYVLRMSGEMHDWLAGLRDDNPAVARYVVQALAALMQEGDRLGEPLVVSTAGDWPDTLVEAVRWSYNDGLDQARDLMRDEIDARVLAKELADQLRELLFGQDRLEDLHRRALDAGRPEQAARLAGELAALLLQRAEMQRRLSEASQVRQRLEEQHRQARARVEAANWRKEVLKASYIAAHSGLLVDETIADSEQQAYDGEAISAARAMIRDLIAQMERELDQQPWPEGLMELRPGTPDGIGIRILFGAEPPGTALLIAALEGAEAVADHRLEAILLSAEVLHQVRAGQAPEASARGYDDMLSFLAELYPREIGEPDAGGR